MTSRDITRHSAGSTERDEDTRRRHATKTRDEDGDHGFGSGRVRLTTGVAVGEPNRAPPYGVCACVIHDITRSSPPPRSCACRAPRRRTRGSRTRTAPASRGVTGTSCHRHRNVVVRERKPALERRPRGVVLCVVTPPSETDRTRATPFGI